MTFISANLFLHGLKNKKQILCSYSTPEVVNKWKFHYRGKMFHSHGSNHSRGVLVLINENLQFEVKNLKEDIHGRFVAFEALIQESPFLLLNLYAPLTKCSEQCNFFDTILSILEEINADASCQIIIMFILMFISIQ